MNKIKTLRDHQTYEVFNSDYNESAYFEGKPMFEDLSEIFRKKGWNVRESFSSEEYVENYIHISKVKIYYRDTWVELNPMPKRPRGTIRCPRCSGCGFKMDNSCNSFGCQSCKRKGYVEKTESCHSKG